MYFRSENCCKTPFYSQLIKNINKHNIKALKTPYFLSTSAKKETFSAPYCKNVYFMPCMNDVTNITSLHASFAWWRRHVYVHPHSRQRRRRLRWRRASACVLKDGRNWFQSNRLRALLRLRVSSARCRRTQHTLCYHESADLLDCFPFAY